MRKITIEGFGPIKKIDVSLDKNLSVIIGQQASGKSTFAKTVYFCRKIRDYCFDYANMIMGSEKINESELYLNFLKHLRKPFMGYFGTTKHMDRFFIRYFFECLDERYVTITLDPDGYARFKFSPELERELKVILKAVAEFAGENDDSWMMDIYEKRKHFSGILKKRIMKVFADDEKLLYIPAGRNMLALLSESINLSPALGYGEKVNIDQTDLITQEFIMYIASIKSTFGSRLDEITKNYLKTVQGQIRNRDVEVASELIHNILRGDYIADSDGEKLYYDTEHWVKIMFASSGQQEILWALNMIFLTILKNEKTFLDFEEPESHLFPDAQENIAKLVGLMINSSKSEVLITTHSPYMLTSFNMLIYSSNVEKDKSMGSIVDKWFRIEKNSVAAYGIGIDKIGKNGTFVNLLGKETGLIDAYQIDHVSTQINEIMDRLFDLE